MGLFSAIKSMLGLAPEADPRQAYGGLQRLGQPRPARLGQLLPMTPAKRERLWCGPNQQVLVGPHSLSGPFIYTVASAVDLEPAHPSTVLTKAPIGQPEWSDPSYWPSYATLSPGQRGAFLDWLKQGRRTPGFPVGLVFVFFYGLERRCLIDRADLAEVHAEVLGLLGVYGDNNSFRSYAGSLLAVIHAQDETIPTKPTWTAFARRPRGGMPTTLTNVLLTRATQPLGFDQALEVLTQQGCSINAVHRSAWQQFVELVQQRFNERYPQGYAVPSRAHLAKNEDAYHWAAVFDRRPEVTMRVVDFVGQQAHWQPLVGEWTRATKDLRAYAKIASTGGVAVRESFEALPPELRSGLHPDYDYWDEWFTAKKDVNGHVATSLGVLMSRQTTDLKPSDGKLKPAQAKALAEHLALMGLAIEPDPRASTKNLELDDLRILYRPSDGSVDAPDATYHAVQTLVELCVMVAAADGAVEAPETERLLAFLDRDGELSSDQRDRLRAHITYQQQSGVDASAPTKARLAKLPDAQRSALASMVVAVALADGEVTDAELAALRKVYRALGKPSAELDRLLAPSTEQVAGSTTAGTTTRTRIAINHQAVAQLMAETREVQAVLAQALAASASEEFMSLGEVIASTAAPASTSAPQAASVASAAPVSPAAFSSAAASDLEGLDPRAAKVLDALRGRDEVAADTFRAACKPHGLMAGAAVTLINEWADTALGDLLIDGDNPYRITWSLLR